MNIKNLRIIIIGFVLLLIIVGWSYNILDYESYIEKYNYTYFIVSVICVTLFGLSFIGFFSKRPYIISHTFKFIIATWFIGITSFKDFSPDYAYSLILVVLLLSMMHTGRKHFIIFFTHSFVLLILFIFFTKDPLILIPPYIVMYVASGFFMFLIIRSRESSQKKLQKAQADAYAILQCSYGMFFYLDKEYRIVTFNKNAEKDFALVVKKEIKAGNFIFDYMPQNMIAPLKETLNRCTKGEIIQNQTMVSYPNADTRWSENIFSPVYNEYKDLIGISFQIVNITDRKHFEEALKTSVKEKEILLREIHHRVKNNLQVISSLLRLQSYNISDDRIMEVFNDAQNRLHSMSMVHEKLYNAENFSNINIAEYINDLIDSIAASYNFNEHRAHFIFNVEPLNVNLDTLIPVGLIINELVTNALKHAFTKEQKGTIEVNFRKLEDNKLNLCVKDDGIGIAESIDIENIETLGLKLVQILASQINGTLEIKNDHGSLFCITFEELHKKNPS